MGGDYPPSTGPIGNDTSTAIWITNAPNRQAHVGTAIMLHIVPHMNPIIHALSSFMFPLFPIAIEGDRRPILCCVVDST